VKTGTANSVTAAVLFAAMLALFLATVSPTISFWDSSEYITSSYIMGIPHPPGSPLLTMVTRVMMMIPFYDIRGEGLESLAYRANLVAVLTAALTVLITYLVTVKLITRMTPFSGDPVHDGLIMFCGIVSSTLAGLAPEFWENAVEFETYMPALLLSMLAVWCVLRWEDASNDPRSIRFLFLAVYLVFLGRGVHLTVFLIVPTLLLFVICARPGWFSSIVLWLGLAAVVLVMATVSFLGGKSIVMAAVIVCAGAGPFIIMRFLHAAKRTETKVLAIVLLCLAVGSAGATVYPTVMVRAAKNPAINEGDPDTLSRYAGYLNRSQYSQGNMLTGIFHRNASFSYQFGTMYLRYFLEQLPAWGPAAHVTFTSAHLPGTPGGVSPIEKRAAVPLGVVFLLLFGAAVHFRRDTGRFAAVFLYFLVTSAGLVLYLNMENPQVRERAYFFLGSFHIAMVWIGIGMHGILRRALHLKHCRLGKALTLACAVMFATLPPSAVFSRHIDPVYSAYRIHDRSGDRIPCDYALNMLASCERDAILFTHGDNDTYPLWYAQQVEGVRRDVAVINLSILNAPWYIKQLRDGPAGIPVAFSDDYIDGVLGGISLRSYEALRWTPYAKHVTISGLTWDMPPDYVTGDGKSGFLTVSSLMVVHIIEQVNWKRPIYFSTYVAPPKMIGLVPFMSMEGMVYRLTRERSLTGDYHVDTTVLASNLYERYRYRGITDATVYKSPETVSILQNYFIGFIELLDRYAEAGNRPEALRAARMAFDFSLGKPERLALLRSVLNEKGLEDEIPGIFAR